MNSFNDIFTVIPYRKLRFYLYSKITSQKPAPQIDADYTPSCLSLLLADTDVISVALFRPVVSAYGNKTIILVTKHITYCIKMITYILKVPSIQLKRIMNLP